LQNAKVKFRFEMSGSNCIVTGVLISEKNYIRNSATDWESL
jgi:hypothetical protein